MKNALKTMILAAILAATTPANAGTVAGMGGSTEITQLLNNSELMAVVGEQAATYGVQLEEYIRAYQEMERNMAGMQNAGAHVQAYGQQIDKLKVAKAALSGLSAASGKHAELLRADAAVMQQNGLTLRQYAAKIAAGAREGHEASQRHLEEVAKSNEDLAVKSQAVKDLHLENLKCDGQNKCLQGIATQNAQLSEIMIEMSGDIKQLLAIQLKRDIDNKADIAAQMAKDYGDAKANERASLRDALIKQQPRN